MFAKRGKNISSRKLRNHAKKVDGLTVDYRLLGYVTEVKDQVKTVNSIHVQWFWSRLNHDHMGTNIAHRATVVHAGPSVLREPLRDSCTRRPVSLYLWVNRTWWTAPNLTVPMAAAEPGWPMPTTTWSATGYSRRAPTRTPQWWGSIFYWNALPTETVYYSSLPLAKCS